MHSRTEVRTSLGLLVMGAALGALGASCGGSSDSEVSSGGSPSSAGNSVKGGDSAASSGSSSGGSDTSGSSNEPEAGSPGSDAGGAPPVMGDTCEEAESWTEALHYVLDVTWPATTAGEKGAGTIDIWSRVQLKAKGNDLQVGLHACGSVLPETKLTVAGKLATGGEKVLVEVNEAVWDAPSIPITMATGTQSGFKVGSSVEFSYVSLLGVTLEDPKAAWPESGADLVVTDLEKDGASGYTATPRSGGGYVLPPTAVGLAGSAPKADKVYLVSRQGMTLKGTRTACGQHSGKAEVSEFDNHVVGCHIEGGSECSEGQQDFVDQNRMRYVVSSARYEAVVVKDDASCSAVRAALPAK